MTDREELILVPGGEPVRSLDEYRSRGGVDALREALKTGPTEIIDVVRQSGLRGRGGAGFPTAIKWESVRSSSAQSKFVCCNGAEGEPGTFKDRYLLRNNPYQVLHGLLIAAHVVGAERAYMCVKRRFEPEIEALRRAQEELGSEVPAAESIELVLGPDEYLYGEEKGLLEVVEGGLPLPRVFPPYIHGLFAGALGGATGNPTAVNNVETLSHVSHIVRRGAEWFRSFGTDDTPGTTILTVSGDVQRPTVRELPLGLTLRSLIDDVAGGPRAGRQVKAVFPGLASAVITPERLDTPLGFDSMKAIGSALGSGGFIVYDDTACMVQAAYMFARFLHIESCNQCPPCKIGSREIMERLERCLLGTRQPRDVDEVLEIGTWVESGQRCALPSSTAVVIPSIVYAFPDDFEAHARGTCDLRHDLVLPKMTNYVEGKGFEYDQSYVRKKPDWSYTPA